MDELLPAECWYLILEYLEIPNIGRLILTSKSWYNSDLIKQYIRILWHYNFLLPIPEHKSSEILKLWTAPENFPFKDVLPKITGSSLLCCLKFTNWYQKLDANIYQELPIYKEVETVIDKLHAISNSDNHQILNVKVKTMARNALKCFSDLFEPQIEEFTKNWSVWILLSDTKSIYTTSEKYYNIHGLFDTKPSINRIYTDVRTSDIVSKAYPLQMDAVPRYYSNIIEMELTGKFPDGFSVEYFQLPADIRNKRFPKLKGTTIETGDDMLKFLKALSICGYHAKMKLC